MAGMMKLPGGNLLYRSQYFSANGTFTVPNTVPSGTVYVTLKGGGSGGGGSVGPTQSGLGGREGMERRRHPVTGLTSGESVTITIGTGGAGGPGSDPPTSTAGGATSFGAYLSVAGGGSVGLRNLTLDAGGCGLGGAKPVLHSGSVGFDALANSGAGGGGAMGSTGTSGGAGGTGYLYVEWYERYS